MFRIILEAQRKSPSTDPVHLASTLSNLGVVLIKQEKYQDAEPHLREAIQVFKDTQGAEAFKVGVAMMNLGRCLTGLNHFEEAEQALLEGYGIMSMSQSPEHPYVKRACELLGELYEAWGKKDQAEKWRATAAGEVASKEQGRG